ncbi:hypothetical protein [Microbacterium sp. BF1]|uniref:hypothetical protein n=1 Tax=Microbacterium sp. BF1 TaxID=2821146 RepID=UPI001C4DE362|nr:hypothetical protein [Microbacterium sp. BF1]
MTDASGTQPEEPVIPEQASSLEEPRSPEGLDLPDESLIPPADVAALRPNDSHPPSDAARS